MYRLTAAVVHVHVCTCMHPTNTRLQSGTWTTTSAVRSSVPVRIRASVGGRVLFGGLFGSLSLSLLKEVVECVRLCPHVYGLHQLGSLGVCTNLRRSGRSKIRGVSFYTGCQYSGTWHARDRRCVLPHNSEVSQI